jgi:hypothetical protein
MPPTIAAFVVGVVNVAPALVREVRRLREGLAGLRDRFAREEAECRASANRPGLSGTADWDTGAARAYEEARLAVMRALAGGEPKP